MNAELIKWILTRLAYHFYYTYDVNYFHLIQAKWRIWGAAIDVKKVDCFF